MPTNGNPKQKDDNNKNQIDQVLAALDEKFDQDDGLKSDIKEMVQKLHQDKPQHTLTLLKAISNYPFEEEITQANQSIQQLLEQKTETQGLITKKRSELAVLEKMETKQAEQLKRLRGQLSELNSMLAFKAATISSLNLGNQNDQENKTISNKGYSVLPVTYSIFSRREEKNEDLSDESESLLSLQTKR